MHAPILYMTTQKEKVWDLSDPKNKELLMEKLEEAGDVESAFEDYVSNMDWCVANTTDHEGWHRGQWNIQETINELFMDTLGKTKELTEVVPGVLSVTVTLQDVKDYYLKMKQVILDHAATLAALPDETDTNKLSDAISQARYQIRHSNESEPRVIDLDLEDDIINIETFESMVYNSTALAEEDTTIYVYTSIQGDYHY